MDLKLQYNCSNIDWEEVSSILEKVGMSHYEGEIHKKAFENSYAVVFDFDNDKLIGF
jgi:hypothetical protein